ncbi:MAG: methionyl-tRNA formyltransferase [Bacteroidales bacterium]|nr:methionyl-tRNA formyltransferase [Bacteroidales bacterium]
MEKLRIVYFGTPEFAASQLEAILAAGYDVAAVVTMPDKPAGRGKKIQFSDVKKTALEHQLPLLQPEKLKNPEFLEELASFNANLFIVVAFRMLPAVVWQMPKYGTFNLHASLLPQYRGAAPINYAIINGETETGLTTFFLNEEIDKGAVIMRETVGIRPNETAGELHDELMVLGNKVVVETIRKIESGTVPTQTQEELAAGTELHDAPKIFKDFCYIDWSKTLIDIYNHIRGLSPYPAAHALLASDKDEVLEMKVYASEMEPCRPAEPVGSIVTDNKKYLKVAIADGYLHLTTVQQAGKKSMSIEDFLRGQHFEGSWKMAKHEN